MVSRKKQQEAAPPPDAPAHAPTRTPEPAAAAEAPAAAPPAAAVTPGDTSEQTARLTGAKSRRGKTTAQAGAESDPAAPSAGAAAAAAPEGRKTKAGGAAAPKSGARGKGRASAAAAAATGPAAPSRDPFEAPDEDAAAETGPGGRSIDPFEAPDEADRAAPAERFVPESFPPPILEPLPEMAPLPDAFGEDRVVVMARDPESAFLYWEITPDGVARARDALGGSAVRAGLTLRIYRGVGDDSFHEDFPVQDWIGRYTLHLDRPGERVAASIGFLADGVFSHVTQSAAVRLPRRSPGEAPVRFVRVGPAALTAPRPAPPEFVVGHPGASPTEAGADADFGGGLPGAAAGGWPGLLPGQTLVGPVVVGSQHLFFPVGHPASDAPAGSQQMITPAGGHHLFATGRPTGKAETPR